MGFGGEVAARTGEHAVIAIETALPGPCFVRLLETPGDVPLAGHAAIIAAGLENFGGVAGRHGGVDLPLVRRPATGQFPVGLLEFRAGNKAFRITLLQSGLIIPEDYGEDQRSHDEKKATLPLEAWPQGKLTFALGEKADEEERSEEGEGRGHPQGQHRLAHQAGDGAAHNGTGENDGKGQAVPAKGFPKCAKGKKHLGAGFYRETASMKMLSSPFSQSGGILRLLESGFPFL